MNKVKYGLKSVHYAPITITEGAVNYGTPVKWPGAVSLNLSPRGEKLEFPADDVIYFATSSNNGYEGTLETALVPDQFKKDILKYKEDENGVLFEDASAIPNDFALLFEFTGDKNAVRHVLYNVNAQRPNLESSTKGQNIEVKTETINITANPAIDTGLVKAKAEPSNATAYEGWYTTVYKYVEPTP